MKLLQEAEIGPELLNGKQVFGPQNEAVGCVNDVIGAGQSATILVDLGGLLCLGGKTVALQASDMRIGREQNGAIMLEAKLAPDELDQLPEAGPHDH